MMKRFVSVFSVVLATVLVGCGAFRVITGTDGRWAGDYWLLSFHNPSVAVTGAMDFDLNAGSSGNSANPDIVDPSPRGSGGGGAGVPASVVGQINPPAPEKTGTDVNPFLETDVGVASSVVVNTVSETDVATSSEVSVATVSETELNPFLEADVGTVSEVGVDAVSETEVGAVSEVGVHTANEVQLEGVYEVPLQAIMEDHRNRGVDLTRLSWTKQLKYRWWSNDDNEWTAWEMIAARQVPAQYLNCAAMPGPLPEPYVPPATVRTTAPEEQVRLWSEGLGAKTNRGCLMGFASFGSRTCFDWVTLLRPSETAMEALGTDFVPYEFLYFRFDGTAEYQPTHVELMFSLRANEESLRVILIQVRTEDGQLWHLMPIDDLLRGYFHDPSSELSFYFIDETKELDHQRLMMIDPSLCVPGTEGQRPLYMWDCPSRELTFGMEARPLGAVFTFGSVNENRVRTGISAVINVDGEASVCHYTRAPQMGTMVAEKPNGTPVTKKPFSRSPRKGELGGS